MPTASERQALVFLTAVALLGGGVRVWQSRQFEQRFGSAPTSNGAPGEAVDDQLSAIDGARSAKKGKHAKTPSAKAEIIDVDIASSAQLERLPRVGAALAQRIVANRDSFGTFGSIEALGRVRGVGVAMRAALAPLITFSAVPSAYAAERASSSRRADQASKVGTARTSERTQSEMAPKPARVSKIPREKSTRAKTKASASGR